MSSSSAVNPRRGLSAALRPLIKAKFTRVEKAVYNRLSAGPTLSLEPSGTQLFIEDCAPETTNSSDRTTTLVTPHGKITLHDASSLFTALGGFDPKDAPWTPENTYAILWKRLPKTLQAWLGWWRPLHEKEAISPEAIHLILRLESNDLSIATSVSASAKTWYQLLHADGIKTSPDVCHDSPLTVLPIPCKIGEMVMSGLQWREVEEGDLIFMEGDCFSSNGIGKVNIFGRSLAVQVRMDPEGKATGLLCEQDLVLVDTANKKVVSDTQAQKPGLKNAKTS